MVICPVRYNLTSETMEMTKSSNEDLNQKMFGIVLFHI
jgi:hypothetical protein